MLARSIAWARSRAGGQVNSRGIDRPELGAEQRHRREAGRDVHALGDPVEPDRPRRPAEPERRVLDEVAEQPGDETDAEGHAEREPEQAGQPGRAQLRVEAPRRTGPGAAPPAAPAAVAGARSTSRPRPGSGRRHLGVSVANHRPASVHVSRTRRAPAAASAARSSAASTAQRNGALGWPSPSRQPHLAGPAAGCRAGQLDDAIRPSGASSSRQRRSSRHGIAADADVAVGEQQVPPPAVPGQRREHVPAQRGGAAGPGQPDGGGADVDAERGMPEPVRGRWSAGPDRSRRRGSARRSGRAARGRRAARRRHQAPGSIAVIGAGGVRGSVSVGPGAPAAARERAASNTASAASAQRGRRSRGDLRRDGSAARRAAKRAVRAGRARPPRARRRRCRRPAAPAAAATRSPRRRQRRTGSARPVVAVDVGDVAEQRRRALGSRRPERPPAAVLGRAEHRVRPVRAQAPHRRGRAAPG